jgi:hypothetical protein
VLTLCKGDNSNTIQEPPSLWEEAWKKLLVEDKEALQDLKSNKLECLEQLLKRTEESREYCRKQSLKFTFRGKVVIARDLTDKLLTWVEKFKEIGDTMVQYDPVHAALPWAGFRFLLQVCLIARTISMSLD